MSEEKRLMFIVAGRNPGFRSWFSVSIGKRYLCLNKGKRKRRISATHTRAGHWAHVSAHHE